MNRKLFYVFCIELSQLNHQSYVPSNERGPNLMRIPLACRIALDVSGTLVVIFFSVNAKIKF
jgi:hypothetical protein